MNPVALGSLAEEVPFFAILLLVIWTVEYGEVADLAVHLAPVDCGPLGDNYV